MAGIRVESLRLSFVDAATELFLSRLEDTDTPRDVLAAEARKLFIDSTQADNNERFKPRILLAFRSLSPKGAYRTKENIRGLVSYHRRTPAADQPFDIAFDFANLTIDASYEGNKVGTTLVWSALHAMRTELIKANKETAHVTLLSNLRFDYTSTGFRAIGPHQDGRTPMERKISAHEPFSPPASLRFRCETSRPT